MAQPNKWSKSNFVVVVQSLSGIRLFVTPWTEAHQASLSFTFSHSLLRLMSIELVMPSNHLILCQKSRILGLYLVTKSCRTLWLPSLSLCPGVCSNSCQLSQWCYLTILSSAAPFSFCLQSFPASGSFPTSRLFASGGQNSEASIFRQVSKGSSCGLQRHLEAFLLNCSVLCDNWVWNQMLRS